MWPYLQFQRNHEIILLAETLSNGCLFFSLFEGGTKQERRHIGAGGHGALPG